MSDHPTGGRPPKFRPEFIAQAEKLCRLGATDLDIADFFEVDVRTIYRWKNGDEGFCQALKSGKEASDDRVERSLYARATGYTFDAVKVFQHLGGPVIVPYREHLPPDTTAAIFWLKNRRPDEWRDKLTQEHTGPGGGPVQVTEIRRVIVDPGKPADAE